MQDAKFKIDAYYLIMYINDSDVIIPNSTSWKGTFNSYGSTDMEFTFDDTVKSLEVKEITKEDNPEYFL